MCWFFLSGSFEDMGIYISVMVISYCFLYCFHKWLKHNIICAFKAIFCTWYIYHIHLKCLVFCLPSYWHKHQMIIHLMLAMIFVLLTLSGNPLGDYECEQLCLETPTCAWYTHLENQYCFIFADCTSFTTDCTNCYTSMRSCLEG